MKHLRCFEGVVGRIGKGLKVKAKCPRCGHASTRLERTSSRSSWLLYICYECGIKFKLERGWRKKEGGSKR